MIDCPSYIASSQSLYYILTNIASPGSQHNDISGKITDQIHDKVSPVIIKKIHTVSIGCLSL